MQLSGIGIAIVLLGFLTVFLVIGGTMWLRPVPRHRPDEEIIIEDTTEIADESAPSRSDD